MNIDPFNVLHIYYKHRDFFTLYGSRYNVDPRVTEKYINSVTTHLINRYPNSSFISKAEGMLRFNVLEKIPLADQGWPGCTIKHKPVPLGSEPSLLQKDTGSTQTAEL
jgi:hypothetical protein